jgi:leucyl/phenylalanyl-tRNA--protein transferase
MRRSFSISGRMKTEFPYLDETRRFQFPPVEQAGTEGILCMGGNLSPGMLLSAYRQGIFPWYSEEEPLLWWTPDPRFILVPEDLHVPKSMRRLLNKDPFQYSFDHNFTGVISACRKSPRPGQDGTWITEDMQQAYTAMHELGFAHSLEVWQDGMLAGGLYGVSLGTAFFGESMFTRTANASKAGFIYLCRVLSNSGFHFIDSQVYTDHMERFGARYIPRAEYLILLSKALDSPTYRGKWTVSSANGEGQERLCTN